MEIAFKEYSIYENFNEFADDILELAKEILPDCLFFLSVFSNTEQHVLKVAGKKGNININEGATLSLNASACNRIDFSKGTPLVYEDVSKESSLDDIRDTFKEINVYAYLGIPVILRNGKIFGTICAVHENATKFSLKSIQLIEKIAKMFTYYLELESLAYRDQLTDSYNRHFRIKYFEEFTQANGSIFFLDLDGFKVINDRLGHDTGDLILKEVSLRIEQYIKKNNLNGSIFRLGGDEFILNLCGELSEKELGEIATSLIESLLLGIFQ